jgi:hypothetical protein
MSTNGNGQFRDDEVVVRRSKLNGEWVENRYVKVGGKLRVLHQENEQVSIMTEILRLEPDYVVCRATVTTAKGTFTGIGVATLNMDARIGDAIVSLSETRAVARACRHAGYAMDSCGAEELAFTEMEHLKEPAAQGEGSVGSNAQPCVIGSAAADAGREQNGTEGARKSIMPSGTIGRPAERNDAAAQGSAPKNCGNGQATTAQVRALYALTKRARYHEDDIASLLAPFQVSRFEDLPREAASQLIGYIQQEIAA